VKLHTFSWIAALVSVLFAANVLAYDCSGLPEWKRQAYYLADTVVKYQEFAYVNSELRRSGKSTHLLLCKSDPPEAAINFIRLLVVGTLSAKHAGMIRYGMHVECNEF
jgi:hypothetical protein